MFYPCFLNGDEEKIVNKYNQFELCKQISER